MKIFKYSELKTSDFWKRWKPTLEEKHGAQGVRGDEGEKFAIDHLTAHHYFSDISLIVHHDDPFHQMIGIDFTVIRKTGVQLIDAKFGSTFLYWDYDQHKWYVTFNRKMASTKKATTHFLLLSPKGDMWAYISAKDVRDILNVSGQPEVRIYQKDWEQLDIKTNIPFN